MEVIMSDEIKNALKVLNENNYIAIPISKGQIFLCNQCNQNESECRYSTLGYTCSNLICLNNIMKEQLDIDSILKEE